MSEEALGGDGASYASPPLDRPEDCVLLYQYSNTLGPTLAGRCSGT
jgi:hypothetical protein